MSALATEIAVAKEDVFGAAAFDFLDHIINRPDAKAAPEVKPFGAELALHRTTARGEQSECLERSVFPQVQ